MALTEQEQILRNQAIAGRNQKFLQDLESLTTEMSKVFSRMNDVLIYVSNNPELLTLTDNDLANLAKHYDPTKLASAITTLNELRVAAEVNNWVNNILKIS